MNSSRRHAQPVEVSAVIPAHNEQDNVAILLDQFAELSRKGGFSLEVIVIDDGSTDQTLPRLVDAQKKHPFVKIITLPHRRGLSEALRAGFFSARGEILVFYPADRQFHPADIPRMVEKVRSGYDLVTGRKIGDYSKKFVSGFYNNLSRLLFPSIQVSDLNSVKAFRRELINVFDYRHDWHRFWVAIVSEAGYRVGEVDVTLYGRQSGKSKFGVWRIPGAVLDLFAVKFQYHTMRRPLWYFGMSGMAMLAVAFVLGLVALYQRFILESGHRPLVFLVMSLGLSGIVLFAIGFLAESVAGIRQQLESLQRPPRYRVIRQPKSESQNSRGRRPPRDNDRRNRSRGRNNPRFNQQSSRSSEAGNRTSSDSTGRESASDRRMNDNSSMMETQSEKNRQSESEPPDRLRQSSNRRPSVSDSTPDPKPSEMTGESPKSEASDTSESTPASTNQYGRRRR